MKLAVKLLLGLFFSATAYAQHPVEFHSWQMQDAAKIAESGEGVSAASYTVKNWYQAVVPGTVLTTLVENKVYPEPLYGENMRSIPESLNKTSYWYRTTFDVPASYRDRNIWLHFGGINYSAQVWVNGHKCGEMHGAFIRGDFNIKPYITPGEKAVLAVLVSPQPHPGVPHEHTVALGVGQNGGETALDGATFLSTIGWDWLPAIRDRDTGIWLPVTLSDSGPVLVKDTVVRSDLADDHQSAKLHIETALENTSEHPISGTLRGEITGQEKVIHFEKAVIIEPHAKLAVTLDPATVSSLLVENPKLWWPNEYGPQNLSHLKLSFSLDKSVSDETNVQFGIRKVAYEVEGSDNLTLSINGVRIMARGGDWGLDEGMKRIPRERLEAQFRLHVLAHMNIIRNWVGQSTSPDFYDLADRYGILIWDEFFQPNPGDGPNVKDIPTYLANVTDKVMRYRNHPAIVVWCARNEGYPPKELDAQLKTLMTQMDPTRLYQSNSAEGRGVSSHGPYYWRAPRFFYAFTESFKTETGSVSIPTLESIRGMMPSRDWETINDDWAQHDMASGAQRGNEFPHTLAKRYGHIRNLADFARKGSAATYESFRAMYEGRNAQMFKTTTGILTWMSNPAQPSFVWQLYHYDLEPGAALYGAQKAAEMVHIQLNEQNFGVEVVNNKAQSLKALKAQILVYTSSFKISKNQMVDVSEVPASTTLKIAPLEVNSRISPLYFVKLNLLNEAGKVISTNFYWQNVAQEDFSQLESLPKARLQITANSHVEGDKTLLNVHVKNSTASIAILTHLQLRRRDGLERVLPAYCSDNYFSLIPEEEQNLTIEVATKDLQGTPPVIYVDGYNVEVEDTPSPVAIRLNRDAIPELSDATHLVD